MDRERFVLSDTVWEKIEALLPGKKSDRGVTAKDNRLFLEAVLWRARAGLPWRDLPGEFGNWNSVFTRFRRWVRGMVFERICRALSGAPDFEYALIDGTIVTAHQKASGAKGGAETNAIGRSRGGLTTKIVALVDALGNLVRFVLLPGQRHDTVGVAPLIEGVSFEALLGDKAFDADWMRAESHLLFEDIIHGWQVVRGAAGHVAAADNCAYACLSGPSKLPQYLRHPANSRLLRWRPCVAGDQQSR